MVTGRKQQTEVMASSINRLNVERVIYPNPTSGTLYLGEEGSAVPVEVKVFEVTGRLVRTLHPNTLVMDVSDLENGIYLLQITSQNNEVSTHKIIMSR